MLDCVEEEVITGTDGNTGELTKKDSSAVGFVVLMMLFVLVVVFASVCLFRLFRLILSQSLEWMMIEMPIIHQLRND